MNPFWYKFTCFTGGTLGFVVTPNDLADDYDWQLFDVTNRDPNEVFSDPTLTVSYNWSGRSGVTGASSAGTSLFNCDGQAYPLFSSMPVLIKDHNYILLLSHFTKFSPSQNGYKIAFKGGTASITDTTPPKMSKAVSSCSGAAVILKLNKKMKCASLASNGSDFSVAGSAISFSAATSLNCGGFDMDSLLLTLSTPLPPGKYQLKINYGSDGNTLLDNCSAQVPDGDLIPFEVFPIQPTPMDSLTKPTCATKKLTLVFQQKIQCSSIANNGSDFNLTGPDNISVSSASGSCSQNGSFVITVNLAKPIQTGGIYRLYLQKGQDGNTILNECDKETPAGQFIEFSMKDTVNADFNYITRLGCITDTISLTHPGKNGVNTYNWRVDGLLASTVPTPNLLFTQFGKKTIQLTASNGFCSDTSVQIVDLDNYMNAAFDYTAELCPEDKGQFLDKSIGKLISWNWDLGNGQTSNLPKPSPQTYFVPITSKEAIYKVRLIVENNLHCFDTASVNIKMLNTCIIEVPNAFTPNNDGKNDYLYPLNAYKASSLKFRIYNRYGSLVFETTDWTRKWDGKINGTDQPTGGYAWLLEYTNAAGVYVLKKGVTVLIR
jgi:gliding motility-associated-like protein